MPPDSMSQDMVVTLQQAANFIPPPGNAVVLAVLAIITVAVRIHENRKANPYTVKMLKGLCDRSCIISDLVREWFGKLSCEKDLLELTARDWQRTLKELKEFVTEIDNRSYMSRIFHSNEKVKVQCKDLSDRLNSHTNVFVLLAVATLVKNQSQYPANSSVPERSGEGVCSSTMTAADVNDDFVESWFRNKDDDTISAADVDAIVHSLSEQADAEFIVVKRLRRLQSDATVDDQELVRSILSSLHSFQDQASKKVGETEPSAPINTDQGAHPLEDEGDVGKRARFKRFLKGKGEKVLLKHPHVQQCVTYAAEKFGLTRE